MTPLHIFTRGPAPSAIYALSLHDALPICGTPSDIVAGALFGDPLEEVGDEYDLLSGRSIPWDGSDGDLVLEIGEDLGLEDGADSDLTAEDLSEECVSDPARDGEGEDLGPSLWRPGAGPGARVGDRRRS